MWYGLGYLLHIVDVNYAIFGLLSVYVCTLVTVYLTDVYEGHFLTQGEKEFNSIAV